MILFVAGCTLRESERMCGTPVPYVCRDTAHPFTHVESLLFYGHCCFMAIAILPASMRDFLEILQELLETIPVISWKICYSNPVNYTKQPDINALDSMASCDTK